MRLRLKSLFPPEGLLLAGAILLASWNRLQDVVADFAGFAPYTVGLIGFIVGWRLRRSRVLFALTVLALAYLVVSHWAPQDAIAFQLAAFLVPLNLAAIALAAERGVFTTAGLWQWGAIAAQAAGAYAVLRTPALGAAGLMLNSALLPESFLAWTPLGQPALLAFAAGAGLVAAARRFAPGSTGRGYLWAHGAAFLAFQARDSAVDRTLYFAAAGGILVVAAIELSYRLAYHDALTGLPGRRALDEALGRLGGLYTVAMVDVDHFKRLNDTYGHDVGDEVLRAVATRLAQGLRHGEVFRYGGEEFAVLLAGRSLQDSLPLLEQAREAVSRHPFTARGWLRSRQPLAKPQAGRPRKQETITVSIGAAERGGRDSTPEEIIQAADKALYRAKQGGRNQVRT